MFKNNKIYKIDKTGKKKRIFFIPGLKVSFRGKNAAIILHEPCMRFKKCHFILGNNATIEIQSTDHKEIGLVINSQGENSICKIGKGFRSSPNCQFVNYSEPNL